MYCFEVSDGVLNGSCRPKSSVRSATWMGNSKPFPCVPFLPAYLGSTNISAAQCMATGMSLFSPGVLSAYSNQLNSLDLVCEAALDGRLHGRKSCMTHLLLCLEEALTSRQPCPRHRAAEIRPHCRETVVYTPDQADLDHQTEGISHSCSAPHRQALVLQHTVLQS